MERLNGSRDERCTARGGITWKPEKEKIKVCKPEKRSSIRCMPVKKFTTTMLKCCVWLPKRTEVG